MREVLEIGAADIEPTPEFGIGINTGTIIGIAKTGKSVKMILDISKVLTTSEIGALTTLSERKGTASKSSDIAQTEAVNGYSEDQG